MSLTLEYPARSYAQIAELRRLHRPTEVRSRSIPHWLCQRIRERLQPERELSNCALLSLAMQRANCGPLVIDHYGTTTIRGREVFVAEPYPLPSRVVRAKQFANLLGLSLDVSSNSWWYPGFTTRLIFSQPA